jgi:hypothetical protein
MKKTGKQFVFSVIICPALETMAILGVSIIFLEPMGALGAL